MPQLSLSVSILLAFICVLTVVYFVGHMAGRINVDTVIQLVSEDVRAAMARLTSDDNQPSAPPITFWRDACPIFDYAMDIFSKSMETALRIGPRNIRPLFVSWCVPEITFSRMRRLL